MAAPTDQERLCTALDMITKIETTLASLYEKTSSSSSFGDQSRTLASIKELEESRIRWKHEAEMLQQSVNRKRRTLKVQFR